MRTTHLSCIAAVVLACSFNSVAEADVSKAWAAAKDNLPGATKALFAIDVAAAVKSSSYSKLFALAMKEEKDLEQGLTLIKTACKIDPVAVVSGIVVAADPQNEKGVIYVQVTGLDQKKLTTCMENALKAMGLKNPTVTQDAAITTITANGDSLHLSWVTPEVIAISLEPEKKADLQGWIGQKAAFAKTAVAAQIGKLDTKSIAWGAFAFDKPLEDDDLPVMNGYGSLTLVAGKLSTSVRATFQDAKAAAKTLDEMTKEITKEAGRKRTPASLKKVLKAIAIKNVGLEVILTATASEADVLAAFIDAIK